MNEEINEARAQLDAYKKAKDRFEKDRAFKAMANCAVTNVVALLEAIDSLRHSEGEATEKLKKLEDQRAIDLQSAREWGAELVRLRRQIANTVSDKEARKELQAVKALYEEAIKEKDLERKRSNKLEAELSRFQKIAAENHRDAIEAERKCEQIVSAVRPASSTDTPHELSRILREAGKSIEAVTDRLFLVEAERDDARAVIEKIRNILPLSQ